MQHIVVTVSWTTRVPLGTCSHLETSTSHIAPALHCLQPPIHVCEFNYSFCSTAAFKLQKSASTHARHQHASTRTRYRPVVSGTRHPMHLRAHILSLEPRVHVISRAAINSLHLQVDPPSCNRIPLCHTIQLAPRTAAWCHCPILADINTYSCHLPQRPHRIAVRPRSAVRGHCTAAQPAA